MNIYKQVLGLLTVRRSSAIVSQRTGSPTSLNPERVPGGENSYGSRAPFSNKSLLEIDKLPWPPFRSKILYDLGIIWQQWMNRGLQSAGHCTNIITGRRKFIINGQLEFNWIWIARVSNIKIVLPFRECQVSHFLFVNFLFGNWKSYWYIPIQEFLPNTVKRHKERSFRDRNIAKDHYGVWFSSNLERIEDPVPLRVLNWLWYFYSSLLFRCLHIPQGFFISITELEFCASCFKWYFIREFKCHRIEWKMLVIICNWRKHLHPPHC